MIMRAAWLCLFLFLHLWVPQLSADNTSLRCGTSLVSIGDSMVAVRDACGDPTVELQVGERRRYRHNKSKGMTLEVVTYVTEWIYAKDKGEYILTFEGSRLVHKTFSR